MWASVWKKRSCQVPVSRLSYASITVYWYQFWQRSDQRKALERDASSTTCMYVCLFNSNILSFVGPTAQPLSSSLFVPSIHSIIGFLNSISIHLHYDKLSFPYNVFFCVCAFFWCVHVCVWNLIRHISVAGVGFLFILPSCVSFAIAFYYIAALIIRSISVIKIRALNET